MTKKSTLVLVAIAAILTAGVAIVELGPRRQRQASVEAAKQLFTFTADDVQTFVSTSRNETFQLEQDGETWHIQKPVRTQAEPAAVRDLLAILETLEVQTSLDDDAGNLSDYGLESPRRSLEIGTAAGDRHVLDIGSITFDRQGIYVQLDDRPVAILESAVVDRLQPELLPLRSKTLVSFSQSDIQTLEIATTADTPPLELGSEEGRWRITQPRELSADPSEVNALFSQLTFLQAQDVIDTPNENIEVYGLDKPIVTFSATFKSGQDPATLTIGRSEDGSLYVRSSHLDDITLDSSPIASIDPNSLESIPFELFELRNKTLGNISRTLIDTIAIESTNTDLQRSLIRADVSNGNDSGDTTDETLWNVSDQSDRQVSADAILEPITAAEAISFFSDDDDSIAIQALAEPLFALELLPPEGVERESVELTFATQNNRVFVRSSDRVDVMEIETSLFEGLQTAIEALVPTETE